LNNIKTNPFQAKIVFGQCSFSHQSYFILIYKKAQEKFLGSIPYCIKFFKKTYFTTFLNPFPGLNTGTLFARIFIFLPVFGFLPVRAALFLTRKVPNPVKTTSFPIFNTLLISSKTASTISPTSFLEQPAFFETFAIISPLCINI